MNKTINTLQNILDTKINNHTQDEVRKLMFTEQDYDDVHIIFGDICAIAIVPDHDGFWDSKTQCHVIDVSKYYMVFLSEDDGTWFIEKDVHYCDFYWANDYADVLNKAVEYRRKIML